MNNVLIVFASATTANRVKSVLRKNLGISSAVIQTPPSLGIKSCSYSLKIDEDNLVKAWELVDTEGLSTKGVYREGDLSKLK